MEKEAKTQKTDEQKSVEKSVETKSTCGIVMPISSIDSCSAEHWQDVKTILCKAIIDAGYDPKLVSDADDSGVIQKRIVQNLYDNEIVVCDVSCKNSNVMFELGMRLAFDKPTIIVSDEKTSFSFDTGLIEHLMYPRDLNYFKIIDFQMKLTEKIKGTIEASKKPDYTTFLKNFGEFKVAKIEGKTGDINDAILEKLDILNSRIEKMQNVSSSRNCILENSLVAQNGTLENKLTNRIIRSEISRFTKENEINELTLFNNKDDIQLMNGLVSFVSKNPDLKKLCPNQDLLRIMVVDALCPF